MYITTHTPPHHTETSRSKETSTDIMIHDFMFVTINFQQKKNKTKAKATLWKAVFITFQSYGHVNSNENVCTSTHRTQYTAVITMYKP